MSIILSLVFVLMMVSCASTAKESDLIGKWTEEDSKQVEGLPYLSIEFFDDGKVIIADKYNGTYEILDNGQLQVTLVDAVYHDPFKIKGNKLTITQDDGDSKSYIKQ